MMQKVVFNRFGDREVHEYKINGVLYADTNGNKLVVVHATQRMFNNKQWLAVDSKTGLFVFAEKTKKELIESLSTYNQNRLYRYIEHLSSTLYQKQVAEYKKILDGDSNDI